MLKLAVILPFLAFTALAQTSSNRTSAKSIEKPTLAAGIVTDGVRIGIFKANYEGILKFSGQVNNLVSYSERFTVDLDTSNGLSVGYISVPIRSIGYDMSASLMEIILNDRSANLVRVNSNATYGFTKKLYSKLGLNYSKYVGRGARNFDGDVGYQFGLGFQVTPRFGLDLTMSETKMAYNEQVGSENYAVDYRFRGLEMGLTSTF